MFDPYNEHESVKTCRLACGIRHNTLRHIQSAVFISHRFNRAMHRPRAKQENPSSSFSCATTPPRLQSMLDVSPTSSLLVACQQSVQPKKITGSAVMHVHNTFDACTDRICINRQ
ncbi:hypothetical protein EVAR_72666_1 [Eumeta japonica]|uniref:Uncharacterized protein n=1 Tax=Eumeta variegata TaxID=151549 RepID=A0A4C1TIV7_EUMVA|nr:hypothetical protein EVAR_72666_1 [Eumeta japonica]